MERCPQTQVGLYDGLQSDGNLIPFVRGLVPTDVVGLICRLVGLHT